MINYSIFTKDEGEVGVSEEVFMEFSSLIEENVRLEEELSDARVEIQKLEMRLHKL